MFYEVETVNLSDQELLERQRVAALCEYDRYLRDYGHKELEEALWWDDGSAFTTWFRGNIRDFFRSSPAGASKPQQPDALDGLRRGAHKVNNTVVWLNGDRAVAEAMCVLYFRYKLDGDWFDGQTYGRMHYRAEKRDGKWGLLHFTGIYEWDRLDPVFQDCEVVIPRQSLLRFRNSNFNMAYKQYRASGAVSNLDSWPGPDRTETIETLYAKNSTWFFGAASEKEDTI